MIVIEKKSLHVSCYRSILYVSDDKIVLLCREAKITIVGTQLKIAAMNQDEIKIEGLLLEIGFIYENRH